MLSSNRGRGAGDDRVQGCLAEPQRMKIARAELEARDTSSIAHKSSPIAPAKPSLNQEPPRCGRATPASVWSSTV